MFDDVGVSDCRHFGETAIQLIDDFQPDILIIMQRYPETVPFGGEVENDRLFRAMQRFIDTVEPLVGQKILLDRPMLEFAHKNGPLEMAKRLEYGMDLETMGFDETVGV